MAQETYTAVLNLVPENGVSADDLMHTCATLINMLTVMNDSRMIDHGDSNIVGIIFSFEGTSEAQALRTINVALAVFTALAKVVSFNFAKGDHI